MLAVRVFGVLTVRDGDGARWWSARCWVCADGACVGGDGDADGARWWVLMARVLVVSVLGVRVFGVLAVRVRADGAYACAGGVR